MNKITLEKIPAILDSVVINAGAYFYKVFVIKINGISRDIFQHNVAILRAMHMRGIHVPRSWRETNKIAHIPLHNINFAQLTHRGVVNLFDIDGKSIPLHGRAKRAIYQFQSLIHKKFSEKPIGTKRNLIINSTNDFKNGTYSFLII